MTTEYSRYQTYRAIVFECIYKNFSSNFLHIDRADKFIVPMKLDCKNREWFAQYLVYICEYRKFTYVRIMK